MRKITKNAVEAFLAKKKFNSSNTRVEVDERKAYPVRLLLHGNIIAVMGGKGNIKISDANWQTATTKERLNGLLEMIDNSLVIKGSAGNWRIFRRFKNMYGADALSFLRYIPRQSGNKKPEFIEIRAEDRQ